MSNEPVAQIIRDACASLDAEEPMRNPHPMVERLRGLYSPASAATLASSLPEIADGTSAQLEALARDPDPERCERVAQHLDGVRRHVNALRDQLQREGGDR